MKNFLDEFSFQSLGKRFLPLLESLIPNSERSAFSSSRHEPFFKHLPRIIYKTFSYQPLSNTFVPIYCRLTFVITGQK